jgi:hypothetical protein
MGFGGRSLFEPVFPEKYLWGIYRRRQTTMHTSGGMGHWFPFRLGVPAEAPILVLEEAQQHLGHKIEPIPAVSLKFSADFSC